MGKQIHVRLFCGTSLNTDVIVPTFCGHHDNLSHTHTQTLSVVVSGQKLILCGYKHHHDQEPDARTLPRGTPPIIIATRRLGHSSSHRCHDNKADVWSLSLPRVAVGVDITATASEGPGTSAVTVICFYFLHVTSSKVDAVRRSPCDLHLGIQTGSCVKFDALARTCEVVGWCPVEAKNKPPRSAWAASPSFLYVGLPGQSRMLSGHSSERVGQLATCGLAC